MWSCPHCRRPLEARDDTLACEAGHRFDIAREGYVNLLPANRKRSRDPGDSKDMIAARRRVHDAGLYRPLAEGIQALVASVAGEVRCLLDLGCGEGFYSAALLRAVPGATLYGIDIAKPAVRLAAKRNTDGRFAVASAFDVPLADHAVDLLASVFAPANDGELRRLLRPGGYYLKVTPNPRHLWELRELLYDQPLEHPAEERVVPGFEAVSAETLAYSRDVDAALLADLVAMTPYAHRGQRERRAALAQVQQLRLTMAFRLSLQRRAGA
jgi:23S rRNA (guanine745-N1)-methyltransferase